MNLNTRHGVLRKDLLVYMNQHTREYQFENFDLDSVFSVAELCQMALDHNLTHLWVMWSTTYVCRESSFKEACEDWDLLPSWYDDLEIAHKLGKEPLLRSVTGFRKPKGGQKQVQVIFVANTLWSFAERDFQEQLTPGKLLQIIWRLEHALEVPIGGGPATVGWKFLTKCNAKHPEWLRKPSANLSALPFKEATPSPLLWARSLTEEEQGRAYVHKIDKNSMYLRACVEEMFGCGELMHRDLDGAFLYAEDLENGIYLVQLAPSFDVLANDMKPVRLELLPPVMWLKSMWIDSSLLKMFLKMGYTVRAYEAYLFRESHGIFKAWANELWRFRSSFVTGDPLRDAFKEIANRTIGLVSYTGFEMETNKNRPDWRCRVVSGAYANLFYNMMRYALQGIYPCMVSTDALLYVSDSPDWKLALPDIEKHENSLGGYKHVWTLPLDDEVKRILALEKGAALKMGMLNSRAREGEVGHEEETL